MGRSQEKWRDRWSEVWLIMSENKELKHIGIIMDGNGRWAESRGLPRLMGHREGVRAVEGVVRAANDMGIPYLSLYAFSTENWGRPMAEVTGLMELLRFYTSLKVRELHAENVRMRFAGKLAAMPGDVAGILRGAEDLTANNTGLVLVVCLNYGGRQEILDALNSLIAEGAQLPITAEDLQKHLYLPDIPDPDLLIRTGGELRMSNFWLWQGAYSEYYSTEKYWPDFDRADLETAVEAYYRRERRYGKVYGKA